MVSKTKNKKIKKGAFFPSLTSTYNFLPLSHIEFNICAGGMQKVGETVVGTLFVDINGSPENMQKAFAYLNQNGIKVEETHQ